MNEISAIFRERKELEKRYRRGLKSKTASERAELIEKFLTRLNKAREGTPYPPLKPAAIAFKLSHIPTSDLYAFYKECERAKNFGAYFWWALNPDRHGRL